MFRSRTYRFFATLTFCHLALATTARADVTPEQVELELDAGDSAEVATAVTLPEAPPKLDVLLLVDVSASFDDDLPNLRALAPGIAADIRAMVPDSRFAVASFADLPFDPWGSGDDYGYRLQQDFTTETDTWLEAIGELQLRDGGDGPESQYEALFQAVTGAGLEMPISDDGDYADRGEIAPGQAASFRPDATRVIAILTDTSFHNPGDTCAFCFEYPGASRDDAVLALQDAGIKVVAIKAPGASDQMDDIAEATGGAVVQTRSDSRDISQAILDGLQSVTFDVRPDPGCGCRKLNLAFNPTDYSDAPAGGTVLFDVSVTAPSVNRDRTFNCRIRYLADGEVVGTQLIRVRVEKPRGQGGCKKGKKHRKHRKHRRHRRHRRR